MYQPSDEIVNKYAKVLINFALNGGEGVRPGEVVNCLVPVEAIPMYGALQRAILAANAYPLMMLITYQYDREFFELAKPEQLAFFPEAYTRGLVDQINHRLAILPRDAGPHALEGIDPERVELRKQAQAPFRRWVNEKEMQGKLSWTLGMWGTEIYAKEAGMTLEEYWEQIIAACYLADNDPVASWREAFAENGRVRAVLNAMPIDKIHVEAPETDLWLTLGQKRLWVGGSGRNIPSFEIFTSEDWRGTHGRILFNQPLYYSGNRLEGIWLKFENGVVVASGASKNENVLHAMINKPNANKLGEFALTDGRYSRITRFMADTLFDENMGGPDGSMHVALGMAYADTYNGNPLELKPEDWEKLGYNDVNCPIHTDIISTSPRKVTAVLYDTSEVVIYEGGRFVI